MTTIYDYAHLQLRLCLSSSLGNRRDGQATDIWLTGHKHRHGKTTSSGASVRLRLEIGMSGFKLGDEVCRDNGRRVIRAIFLNREAARMCARRNQRRAGFHRSVEIVSAAARRACRLIANAGPAGIADHSAPEANRLRCFDIELK